MIRRWWRILLLMAVVGLVLGLLTAAVVTYVMPKKYESTAVVQVISRPVYVPASANGTGEIHQDAMTPQFLATEFEVIQSRKVLQRVVDALDLTMRWGVRYEEALAMLKDMISTEIIRDCPLIHIRVRHSNAEDARDIAMEVARSYRSYRAELENERAKQALKKIDDALQEQEDRVEERRKALNKIVETIGMLYVNPPMLPGPIIPKDATKENLRQMELGAQLIEARKEFEQARDTLVEMRMKYRTESIQLELPHDPTRIHEEPTLARRPCSPNVSLNLVLGLFAGPPLGLLLAFPLMWIADRLTRTGRTRA